MLPSLTFVLGGAASGKSVFAESICENSGLSRVYLATAQAWDDETKSKINLHKERRDNLWESVEAPVELSEPLLRHGADTVVLLDCATMWLSNLMFAEADVEAAVDQLMQTLSKCQARVVVVSNEVGQGIVPENALARRFREAQGRLNIRLAKQANCVVQVVAGLPNVLKGHLP